MIVTIILFAILIPSLLYFYITGFNCESIPPFLLEFVGSFALGAIVWYIGMVWEKKWATQSYRMNLRGELRLLKNILKNIFMRDVSDWNFKNSTPSFYYDRSRANQIHDLLTDQGRRWEQFVLNYHDEFGNRESLVETLLLFISTMSKALIVGEKIDNELRIKIINPQLALLKESPHVHERTHANDEMDLTRLIARGYFVDATDEDILFGIARYTNEKINLAKIAHTKNTINTILPSTNLPNLIKELKGYRKSLEKICSSLDLL